MCTPPRPAPQSVQPRALSLCTLRAPRGRPVHTRGKRLLYTQISFSHALVFRIGRGPPRVVGSSENRNRQDVPIATLYSMYRHAGGRGST